MDPTALEGDAVRLEPLQRHHQQPLCDAIRDGELWKLMVTIVPHPENIDSFFARAERERDAGEGFTLVTIDQRSQRVVGSTRFMKYHANHRRVEIGYTFLCQSAQKTSINTEAKLLMLQHAFDTVGLNRVEFLTDYLNRNSQRAILRLGAKEEGILRNHMMLPDGRIRDSVIFSIARHEWPGIRQHLQSKLNR